MPLPVLIILMVLFLFIGIIYLIFAFKEDENPVPGLFMLLIGAMCAVWLVGSSMQPVSIENSVTVDVQKIKMSNGSTIEMIAYDKNDRPLVINLTQKYGCITNAKRAKVDYYPQLISGVQWYTPERIELIYE
jgi:hypothetical protein